MGVKELWSVLTPFAERKPLYELRGKTVAIDLAGWVCESLNVVDYFVHPRQHLKNLFFRTVYLIWEEVTPIFVLEGTAPSLKSNVIAQRNELQFRGTKARKNNAAKDQEKPKSDDMEAKKRTRFNHVLKQCENLLNAMGVECVQAPGEAEAYCAFLNRKNMVDGVISQDSDCFAYGAVRVYRNFSVSTQGAQAAHGGAVDIYDMEKIKNNIDFGQSKIIAMALFCGCDYCPDGVGGVGRDSVLKLFAKYKENEILERIRCWRQEDDRYSALEMRVNDKNICSNCGHIGRTQAHTKSGCGICRTPHGCNETLWKEERLSIKAELILRKKALVDPSFPCEEIIKEFTSEPLALPNLKLNWAQPNMIKFMKQIGHLLQWTEIYCFSKFFPILTRWQVRNYAQLKQQTKIAYVIPKEIVKKRTVKGVLSLEIVWHDEQGFFNGLIPEEQLQSFNENDKGIQTLWTTIEPLNLVELAYPALVEDFYKRTEKPQRKKKKAEKKENRKQPALNLADLAAVTAEIAENAKVTKAKNRKRSPLKGIQKIDKFFKTNIENNAYKDSKLLCSTPHMKSAPSDLDSDDDADQEINLSDVINGIIQQGKNQHKVLAYTGRALHYEAIETVETTKCLTKSHFESKDDLNVLPSMKRERSLASTALLECSLDDSFDILVKAGERRLPTLQTHVKRFKEQHQLSSAYNSILENCANSNLPDEPAANTSYFFASSFNSMKNVELEDGFERIMQGSFVN